MNTHSVNVSGCPGPENATPSVGYWYVPGSGVGIRDLHRNAVGVRRSVAASAA
jgi:hypothetical protein